MSNVYIASSLTGNTPGSLDYINPLNSDGLGEVLNTDDICYVFNPSFGVLLYKLYNDGTSHNPPNFIVPANNPSTWCWKSLVTNKVETYIGTTAVKDIGQIFTHSADPNFERVVKAGFMINAGTSSLMYPDLFEYEIISATETKVTLKNPMGIVGNLIVCIVLPR